MTDDEIRAEMGLIIDRNGVDRLADIMFGTFCDQAGYVYYLDGQRTLQPDEIVDGHRFRALMTDLRERHTL